MPLVCKPHSLLYAFVINIAAVTVPLFFYLFAFSKLLSQPTLSAFVPLSLGGGRRKEVAYMGLIPCFF